MYMYKYIYVYIYIYIYILILQLSKQFKQFFGIREITGSWVNQVEYLKTNKIRKRKNTALNKKV